jgi:hypothetical protein
MNILPTKIYRDFATKLNKSLEKTHFYFFRVVSVCEQKKWRSVLYCGVEFYFCQQYPVAAIQPNSLDCRNRLGKIPTLPMRSQAANPTLPPPKTTGAWDTTRVPHAPAKEEKNGLRELKVGIMLILVICRG